MAMDVPGIEGAGRIRNAEPSKVLSAMYTAVVNGGLATKTLTLPVICGYPDSDRHLMSLEGKAE